MEERTQCAENTQELTVGLTRITDIVKAAKGYTQLKQLHMIIGDVLTFIEDVCLYVLEDEPDSDTG
jgi:hypothetical protein